MSNNMAETTETLELSATSQSAKQEHDALMLNLEIQKRANTLVDVPTLAQDIRTSLRNLNEPVRLFGENPANVRDRLRMCMARRYVLMERGEWVVDEELQRLQEEEKMLEEEEEGEEVTKYTHASAALISAREHIATYSIGRARERLEMERRRRLWKEGDDEKTKEEVEELDKNCRVTYASLRGMTLDGSQYGGEGRILSSIKTFSLQDKSFIVTAGWSAAIQLWDGDLDLLATHKLAHEDRIMNIDVHPHNPTSNSPLIATASVDTTAKIWSIVESDPSPEQEEQNPKYEIRHCATLSGHLARLGRVAFHPSSLYAATTSFDHTWRLWDVNTSQELLLQDGHWKETFGVAFHDDGGICAVSDFSGVIHLWDLRSGKTILNFMGHAKRVLNTLFHPNGFQLSTSGDDGTIKIWDLRRRQMLASIPAHNGLISQMVIDREKDGESIVTSSFDGTIKSWSARDWHLLNTLKGHEGKVMSVDFLYSEAKKKSRVGIVSVGYDKTIKCWR